MDINTALQNILSFLWSYGYALSLLALVPMIFFGILTAKLAGKKGYRGYFFTGFFFAVIGLIYVVGLPLASEASGNIRRNSAA
jgi:hypothetical protein